MNNKKTFHEVSRFGVMQRPIVSIPPYVHISLRYRHTYCHDLALRKI